MVHSGRKLIAGVFIPVFILMLASHIRVVDEGSLATQDALYIMACVVIGMEIILLIEQFGLGRRFQWRESLLRSQLLNSKITWIALPFILAFIFNMINSTPASNTSRALSNVVMIAFVIAAGFDMLWLIKSGFGFFASGMDNNFRGTGMFFGMEGGRMVGRNQDQETLGSIMAHVSNAVVPLIGDPDIKRALTKDDNDAVIVPDMLDRGESIFLQIPMGKIDLWKNFITLIVQQFLGHFQRREERVNEPVLFLLDEFARFGRMDGIMNGLATLRSKKVSICIIIQSLAQLDAIYGEANRKVITDNCVYKPILGASDADTQAYFSRMAETYKMQQVTRTTPDFDPFSKNRGQSSRSTTMVDEPIIRPEEFGRLGNRLLLLTPDRPATFVKKRPYYQW